MENMILSKERFIDIISIKTPILIPSFSSKGFKYIDKIFDNLQDTLTDAALFSAYDLYYNIIDEKSIYETDVLFIDSGGYEATIQSDLSETLGYNYKPNKWTEELYLNQISKIETLTNIVLVNYDYSDISYIEQIKSAELIFNYYPFFASDFLLKSDSGTGIYKINKVLECLSEIKKFSIIGFTEKELGNSVYNRCKNIFIIRRKMNELGLDNIPIHIFGCLDPLNIILYFLCGADIFDGLSWLRYGFQNNIPVYLNTYAISKGIWKLTTDEVRLISHSENVRILKELGNRMREFLNSKDISVFRLDKKTEAEVLTILQLISKEVL